MTKANAFISLLLALLMPTSAQAQPASLSAMESEGVDATIDPFLRGLSTDMSRQPILRLFGTVSSDPRLERLNPLIEQIDGVLLNSGPIQHCEMYDQQLRSSLLVERKYVCQHPRNVSHWRFVLKRLPDGWAVANLSFSTEVEKLF